MVDQVPSRLQSALRTGCRPCLEGGRIHKASQLGVVDDARREIRLAIGLQSTRLRTTFGDEAVDGLVGVVLKRRVGQVGEEVCLVDHGTFQRVGRAGVEHAARQGRVGDAVDQSLRAHVKFVGETQGGHDVFGRYTHRQWEVTGCLGAGGVAGAHGDEAAVGVLAGQVGHP